MNSESKERLIKVILFFLAFLFVVAIIFLILFKPWEINTSPSHGEVSSDTKSVAFEGNVLPLGLKIEKERLERILEVSRKVRVHRVGRSAVPVFFPILFWSFGADQCASSEGFLVTFTPTSIESSGEVILDYSLLPACVGIIQIQPPSGSPPTEQTNDGFPPSEGPKAGSPRREFYKRIPHRLGMEMRRCVMTPATNVEEGILVASKPTDEGGIGTVRNTGKEKIEL